MTSVAALRGVFDRTSGATQGMVLMLCSALCFVGMQSIIRFVGETLPPFEVAFFRNLFGLVALAPIFISQGFTPFKTKKLHMHASRGCIQAIGMLAFFTGVTLIPLAQTTALSFSAPLFATVLAILVLGERVRIRRITALVAGFVGMLLVVRPGFAEINLGTMLIITSSLTWGIAIAIIKSMSKTESSATLTVYMGIFLTPITGVFAFFVWETPTWEQLAWLMLVGILGTVGHLAFAQSFRKADSTAVLPLDFTRLIWASVAGFLIWGEIPDAWAWIGGTVIFGSATYIAYREAVVARKGRREAEALAKLEEAAKARAQAGIVGAGVKTTE
jgi:drug/metabolite transporter (DMT)-like permease